MSRLVSFAVLIAIIVIIGLLFYKVLFGFFIPVFLAAVLVVVFRPLHRWVLEKTGQRPRVAAGLTTLLIMLTMLLPIAAVGTASAVQGLRLIEQFDAQTVALRISQLRASLGLEMPSYHEELRSVSEELDEIIANTSDSVVSEENVKLLQIGKRTTQTLVSLKQSVQEQSDTIYDSQLDELIELSRQVGEPSDEEFGAAKLAIDLKSKYSSLRTALLGGSLTAFARDTVNPTKEKINSWVKDAVAFVRPRLLSLTGATGTFIAKLIFGSVILVVTTFFFLVDGPAMIKNIMHLSPLDDSYEQELLLEFDRISRAVVLATVLSAVAQGLTAGVGFYFAGMEYLSLLIMLTTAFAMVPFVGPAIIWVPVAIYLALNDHVWAAGLLAAWGVLVVGTIDNVVKAVVLHGQSQLHPLLALLSVLGGVQALGPIGIVVGPMVVAMLQTLLSILQRELLHFEQHDYVLNTSPPKKATSPLETATSFSSKAHAPIPTRDSASTNNANAASHSATKPDTAASPASSTPESDAPDA
ncbi:MAG: AI-2E family transporter [Planctomycetales bacterium]|nr:AI-2E family transporter [Planctomycetales bacterium]